MCQVYLSLFELKIKMVYELSTLCWLCSYVFINYIFYEFLLWYYLCYVHDGKYQACAHIQEYDYVASVIYNKIYTIKLWTDHSQRHLIWYWVENSCCMQVGDSNSLTPGWQGFRTDFCLLWFIFITTLETCAELDFFIGHVLNINCGLFVLKYMATIEWSAQ